MNTSDLFVDFLKSHKLIAYMGIEKELKMPPGTIRQAVAGKRKIPEK